MRAFLDRFFPRESRKSKVEKCINLCQGGMNVLDCSLKFTKLCKYAPSLVSNPRDDLSPLFLGCPKTWIRNVIQLCFMII